MTSEISQIKILMKFSPTWCSIEAQYRSKISDTHLVHRTLFHSNLVDYSNLLVVVVS